jgi:hypothetical protein
VVPTREGTLFRSPDLSVALGAPTPLSSTAASISLDKNLRKAD